MKKIALVFLFILMILFSACSSENEMVEDTEKQKLEEWMVEEEKKEIEKNRLRNIMLNESYFENWNIFENETINLEFKYPSEFEISSSDFLIEVDSENQSQYKVDIKLMKLVGKKQGRNLVEYIYIGNENPYGGSFDSYQDFDTLIKDLKQDSGEFSLDYIFEVDSYPERDLFMFHNVLLATGELDILVVECDYRFLALAIRNLNQSESKKDELRLIGRTIQC